jgi:hypothetical protein
MSASIKYGIICLIVLIGFNLFVFYGDYLLTPLGKASTLISYLAIIPFLALSISNKKRKDFKAGIPMRDAVKAGMLTVIVVAVGYAIFTYIFYSVKMTDYIVQYYELHPPKPAKGVVPVKKSDIQEVFSAFNRTKAALIGVLMTGTCMSFIVSVFISKKDQGV